MCLFAFDQETDGLRELFTDVEVKPFVSPVSSVQLTMLTL